jgi:polyisoprenoid-binding protein YceI
MKTFLAAVFAVTTITGAFAADTYKVDPAASKVTYVGKKVTGEHTGNVTVKSGNLVVDGDKLNGGEVVVDMNSLTSTDLTDKDYNAKYVGHMKSPDFFNTEKYPESKLVIKESKKTDKGLEVKGDLTMIGQTKPVTFTVTDWKNTGAQVSGKSTLVLDRTLWGLKYGSDSFFKGLGDKAIKNEFNLTVDLTAKK